MNPGPDEDKTGLPGLRTWRRVYAAVLATTAVWLVLLWALGRAFA